MFLKSKYKVVRVIIYTTLSSLSVRTIVGQVMIFLMVKKKIENLMAAFVKNRLMFSIKFYTLFSIGIF